MFSRRKNKKTYTLLPLRDIVMFPGMVVPLFVGRQKSILALSDVVQKNGEILAITQKDASQDDPNIKGFYDVGVVANVLQMLKLPDGTMKILMEAQYRVKIDNIKSEDPILKAVAKEVEEYIGNSSEIEAIMRSIISRFNEYVQFNKKVNPEILSIIPTIKDPSKFADNIASHLTIAIVDKQYLLEELDISKRLEKIYVHLESEINLFNAEKNIRGRVLQQVEKSQKDYYLHEQMKAIQRELGGDDDSLKKESSAIEERIKKTKLTKEAHEKVLGELKKLKSMNQMSPEASNIRNYIDTILDLPWKIFSKVKNDIKYAKEVLDNDHYGLDKVKDRITEYLAVQQRVNKMKGPILCFVGPPGVGKTSLAKSIADATGRKFTKFSLGGLRDEAEIRGHRRTYLGAMTGKILQLLKKSKKCNPVMLLDEIDKISYDHRGDPSSALLEVLDPEQNDKFSDHYLEVEFDLSDVMFIATANSMNIPRPLLDRMEIIRLSGYTEEEKFQIARKHLIEKQMQYHGLKKNEWSIDDEAINDLIRYYTRESGVRGLEKEIAKLQRKAVKKIMEGSCKSVSITADNLFDYLGVRKYDYGKIEEHNLIGITNGLSYSEVGGDLLAIEAVVLPGKGEIKTTGKLGDVMQESAQAAFSFFRSRSSDYGVRSKDYQERNIHLHVPEGATPKDGPSAGVAMFVSIVSVMTGIAVKRNVAMTGEITLRGRVLAIGGLKEKLLAALRGGIQTVLIPKENMKDLSEMPDNISQKLTIIPIEMADEAIKYALVDNVVKVEDIKATMVTDAK